MFWTRLIRPVSSAVSGWCITHSTVEGTPVNTSRQSRPTTSGSRSPSSAWALRLMAVIRRLPSATNATMSERRRKKNESPVLKPAEVFYLIAAQ